jgi:hypothetical protein
MLLPFTDTSEKTIPRYPGNPNEEKSQRFSPFTKMPSSLFIPFPIPID